MSLRNLTIGSNDTTAILYDPPLCNGTGWVVNSLEGLSGSYRSCTSSNQGVIPSSNLTFTGVAVYYTSPIFEGESIGFILDGAPSVNLSLSAAEGVVSNSTGTRVIWNATALENKQHLLQLHPVNGSRTLNVDAFIVTQLDTNAAASSASSLPTSHAGNSSGSSILGLPVQSAKTTRISIALGTTFGALSFIIFLCIAIFLGRRSRSLKKRYSWNKSIPPIRSQDIGLATINTRRYTLDSKHPPDESTGVGSIMPMNPLPTGSVAPGVSVNDLNPDETGGTKGWVSPKLSNSHLVNQPSSSSHGDDPVAPSTYKLEPVRAPLAGPRARSDSGSNHGHPSSSPFLSRNTTASSKLEPVRSSPAQSQSPPSFFTVPAFTTSGDSANSPSVSRNTTFSSARLEPVRKG